MSTNLDNLLVEMKEGKEFLGCGHQDAINIRFQEEIVHGINQ